jgi:soluble lytic murein transglycosylase-like protein
MIRYALAFIFAALCLSSVPYRSPVVYHRSPPTDIHAIGRIAAAHGVPPDILVGVAFAESSFNRWAVSADGLDLGMFQLRSLYNRERAEKWGEFDPFDTMQSARIAALILRENYERFGRWDKAVAAYNQGSTGVRLRGVKKSYIAKVFGGIR